MSDEPKGGEVQSDDGVDPGEPIAALAGFESDPSSRLCGRVRRKIQRRKTGAQLAYFLLHTPILVLRELWLILNERRKPRRAPGKDNGHESETS